MVVGEYDAAGSGAQVRCTLCGLPGYIVRIGQGSKGRCPFFPERERLSRVGGDWTVMQHEAILQECLEIHKEILELERQFHAWFNQVTGVEVAD